VVAGLAAPALNKKLVVEVLVRCHAAHVPRVLELIHLVLGAEVLAVAAHRNPAILQETSSTITLELLERPAVLLQVLHVRKLINLILLRWHWCGLEGRRAT